MLYSVRGTLLHTEASLAAVECAGVGYLCQTTLSTLSKLPKAGEEVFLYTYLHVREGAVDLFGFADKGELNCFRMLLGVTGVGPKAALSILSNLSPERFALCVAAGDHKAITAAQGVGPKLAQRIILELKDKVKTDDVAKGFGDAPQLAALGSGNVQEAIGALVVLGYSQADAASVVSRLDPEKPVEDLIKAALKTLAGL